jgi:hypothetical protein
MATPGAAVPTRPMTEAEGQQLKRLVRRPGVSMARVFGMLMGLGGLMLSVTYFAGVPYDPQIFVLMAPATGFLGLILSGAASGATRGPREAMKRGEVVDLTAPSQLTPEAPRGMRAVSIGPWTLVMRAKVMERIKVGETQRIAVATGLRAGRYPGYGRVERGLLLSLNGEDLRRPQVVYFKPGTVAPGGAGSGWGAAAPMPPPQVATAGLAFGAALQGAAGERVCGKCGTRVADPSAKFCPQCAAMLAPAAR